MPIKYQMLGGQKGLTELTITVSRPNTTVTITNEKFNKTLVSNDSLTVVCELPNGTYQITARGEDGKTAQQEITISNKEQTDLRIKEQVKNLPETAKFRTKNGWKFIVESKTANAMRCISEYIIDDYAPKEYGYGDEVDNYLKAKLSPQELSKFLEWKHEVTIVDKGNTTTRTFDRTGVLLIPPRKAGTKTYENGKQGNYLIDYSGYASYVGETNYYGSYVDESGKEHLNESMGTSVRPNEKTYGVVVRCRLNPEAYVYQDKDSDYWVITE